MRVVLDTSVWVAALLSSKGASFEIVKQFLDGKIDLILSYEIYAELSRVLDRSYVKEASHLSEPLIKKIKRVLKTIRKKDKDRIKISRDPKDDMFVSAALSYGADFVVTLDKDLLVLKTHKNIRFVKPGELLMHYNITRKQIKEET